VIGQLGAALIGQCGLATSDNAISRQSPPEGAGLSEGGANPRIAFQGFRRGVYTYPFFSGLLPGFRARSASNRIAVLLAYAASDTFLALAMRSSGAMVCRLRLPPREPIAVMFGAFTSPEPTSPKEEHHRRNLATAY
jgi:hypothetical protein